ncbi:outer membrane protein [Novosphingobium sp.]|uniref:outer membrane protein n=1 Tax=Novosphingobium sp. TaxID=1874826 RepID=UPI003B52B2F7
MVRLSKSVPLAALLVVPAQLAPVQTAAADTVDWNGPYGGVHASVVGAKTKWSGTNAYTTTTDGPEGNPTDTPIPSGSASPTVMEAHPRNGESFVTVNNTETVIDRHRTTTGGGGARLGYNYQTGSTVLGVEGDVTFSSFTNSDGGLGNGTAGPNEGYGVTTHGSVVGTVRGRAGLAFDRALLFGTGGVAFTNLRSTLIANSGLADTHKTTTGWVAGGGAEFMLSHRFSIAATVLYNDFGTAHLSAGDSTTGFNAAVKTHYVTGALGVNMHF